MSAEHVGGSGGKRVTLLMSSGLLGLSQLVARVSTLAVMALLVRGAGTESVGYYGLATLAASLIAIGLSFGMPTYLTRQVPAAQVRPDEVVRIHGLRLVVLTGAAAVAYPVLSAMTPSAIHLGFFLFFVASLLDQWNETAWVLVRGTPKAWKEPVANSTTSLVLVAACAADLWLLDGLTFLNAAVYAAVTAAVRAGIAAALVFRGRPRRISDPLRVKLHLRQSVPYLASDLLGLIYFRGDVLILTTFVAAAEVGEYVSATGLINPAVQVAAAMSVGALAFAAPKAFAAHAGRSDPRSIYQFFRLTGLAASGAIGLGLPIAIAILFGSSGMPILQLSVILTLFLSLRFANFGLSAILLAEGGAPRRVLVLLASIAVSVLLNLMLVRPFGAEGSAWAAMLTEFVVAVSLVWASRQRSLVRPVAMTLVVTAGMAAMTFVALQALTPRLAAVVVGLCYLTSAAWSFVRQRGRRHAPRILTNAEEAA
ncbi:MAG: oligosaccharide flippase family protein [Hamadaea sp.]|uniref:lipopolysaccharide biosynthesis protein n=1 Tax=Hamadaea sp. TaxID=2024425 RepID=UPI00181A9352|nr:oligosaccharide flippase family protein [Hamadaea sp.]NUT22826.1 oligosaccharide flippase family protein [Hamadaea sp.]